MRYPTYISGSPISSGTRMGPGLGGADTANGFGAGLGYEEPAHPNSGATLRRFPPLLQFLTRTTPYVEQQLRMLAGQLFDQGRTLDQICGAVHQAAHALGYTATIGVKEVFSSEMPSFPGETIMSALLIMDLRPVQGPPPPY
ncbi:MAG: hypothetical protein RhofKO_04630 [Rhodothermales bacterium]